MPGAQVVGWQVGEVIRQAVPPWLVPAVLAVTRLGNVVVLLALFTVDYWFGDHDRGAHALGLALAGIALVTTLKAAFAEPRPPRAVRLIPTGGFSFPSGHATIAAIGYGALAYDLEVATPALRYAVAAVVVALVALSRVALGVHFVRDVVAGVAVGLAFLAAAEWLTGHRPRPGFLLAAGVGALSLLLAGLTQDTAAEVGAILGAAATWELLGGEIPPVESLREHLVLLGVGLPVFVALSYVALFVALPLAAVFLLNAALLGGVVLAPLPVTRLLRGSTGGRGAPPDG